MLHEKTEPDDYPPECGAAIIAPNGGFLVTCGVELVVRDADTLEPLKSLAEERDFGGSGSHRGFFQSLAVSPDSTMIGLGNGLEENECECYVPNTGGDVVVWKQGKGKVWERLVRESLASKRTLDPILTHLAPTPYPLPAPITLF